MRDHFGSQASAYRAARPEYPQALYDAILSRVAEHRVAADIGAGSGQASLEIARRFSVTIAVDQSKPQLDASPPIERLVRVQSKAERLPIPDASLDLICAAEAAHWFEWPAFLSECSRTLRDGGVFAAWCYYLPSLSPEIDELVLSLYHDRLGHYLDGRRQILIDGYAPLHLEGPWQDEVREQHSMQQEWNFATLLLNLNSSSVVNREQRRTGINAVCEYERRLAEAWGNPATLRSAVWDLHLVLATRRSR